MQNLNHLVSLLQEGYKTIGVVYSAQPVEQYDDHPFAPVRGQTHGQHAGSKVYTFKTFFDCKLGDVVILPPSSEGKLPSMGTVVRVDDEPELNFESEIEYKWAMAKLDTIAYDQVMEREKELVKMLRASEKKQQRDRLLASYQLTLPEDEKSRKIFDQARQIGLTPKD